MRKKDLERFNSKWKVYKKIFDFNIYDRYIKTDNLEIILASGFLNLSNQNKAFIYIVKAIN